MAAPFLAAPTFLAALFFAVLVFFAGRFLADDVVVVFFAGDFLAAVVVFLAGDFLAADFFVAATVPPGPMGARPSVGAFLCSGRPVRSPRI